MGGAQSQATSGGLPSLCWVILGYYAFLIKITYFMVYPPFLPGLHTVIAFSKKKTCLSFPGLLSCFL
eukprot:m.246494 g.246494  ORF g.246494 m.246494 type:complete len:67 (+) comp16117_c0_seq4:3849-4049(+)